LSTPQPPGRPARQSDARDRQDNPAPTFTSRELFGEHNRIRIQHEGRVYALQITRQRKLILTL